MNTLAYPRVLVVSAEPLGSRSGTGLTLQAIFREWPRDRIAQVHTVAFAADAPQILSCHLGDETVVGLRSLRRAIDGRSSGTQESGLATPSARAIGRATWKRAWVDQLPIRATPSLAEFVDLFQPDIIYTPLGFERVLRVLDRSIQTSAAPVVPHFMDDWLEALMPGAASALPRRRIQAHVGSIVQKATNGLAISDAMAAEYSDRWGIPFTRVGNAVDVGDWQAPVEEPVFGYVGGMHLERWRALTDVADAIESVPGARFEIVAPTRDASRWGDVFERFPKTTLVPAVAPAEVPDLLHRYAVLVHAESGDDYARRYTRLSLSTKIPQYLAAGRPVLGYGPQEVASMGHLRSSGAAVLVQAGDSAALADAVHQLAGDAAERSRMGQIGVKFAAREHTVEAQTEALRRVFSDAIAAR